MNAKRDNKRGVVLIIIITFLVIMAITSAGFYNAIFLSGKMQGIDEVRRIKGYYAALGALRYESTLTPPVAMTIDSTHNTQLWTDLGLTGSEKVTITVTGPDVNGQYTVIATYSF